MPGWLFFGVAGAAAWMVRYFLDEGRPLRNEIRRIPAVPIRDAKENEVIRIQGVVRYDVNTPLVAPLTGRSCAAWRVVVVQELGGTPTHWEPVSDRSRCQRFFLDDQGATAWVMGVVHDRQIELLLEIDGKNCSRRGEDSQQLQRFLSANGLPLENYAGVIRYRVHEGIVEEGERVTVVGQGYWTLAQGQAGDYRSSGQRFEIGPMSDGRLLVSDEKELT